MLNYLVPANVWNVVNKAWLIHRSHRYMIHPGDRISQLFFLFFYPFVHLLYLNLQSNVIFASSCLFLPSLFLIKALSLVPEQAELSPWMSPVLVLPVLQLLSCSGLTEALTDRRTHSLNHNLAHSLLRSISRQTDKPRQVTLSIHHFVPSWIYLLSCMHMHNKVQAQVIVLGTLFIGGANNCSKQMW